VGAAEHRPRVTRSDCRPWHRNSLAVIPVRSCGRHPDDAASCNANHRIFVHRTDPEPARADRHAEASTAFGYATYAFGYATYAFGYATYAFYFACAYPQPYAYAYAYDCAYTYAVHFGTEHTDASSGTHARSERIYVHPAENGASDAHSDQASRTEARPERAPRTEADYPRDRAFNQSGCRSGVIREKSNSRSINCIEVRQSRASNIRAGRREVVRRRTWVGASYDCPWCVPVGTGRGGRRTPGRPQRPQRPRQGEGRGRGDLGLRSGLLIGRNAAAPLRAP
jgi:hypothetical protein